MRPFMLALLFVTAACAAPPDHDSHPPPDRVGATAVGDADGQLAALTAAAEHVFETAHRQHEHRVAAVGWHARRMADMCAAEPENCTTGEQLEADPDPHPDEQLARSDVQHEHGAFCLCVDHRDDDPVPAIAYFDQHRAGSPTPPEIADVSRARYLHRFEPGSAYALGRRSTRSPRSLSTHAHPTGVG